MGRGGPRTTAAWIAGLTWLSQAAPGAGAAEGLDASTAEALFRDGKSQLERHDYARACPLLAASVALDPATGALLALAICHEGEGKLASAAAEYDRVATRAAAENRPDRVQVARTRAAAIAPRISTLTIVPPADTSSLDRLSVLRNGVAVDSSSWGSPVPCDGGDYLIEVSAAGRKPWTTTVSLRSMGDARTLVVPKLDPAPAATTSTSPPAPAGAARALASLPASSAVNQPSGLAAQADARSQPAAPTRRPALRIAGLALMGGGLAALATGTFFGLRAISKNQDSRTGCMGNLCDPDGTKNRLDARSAGDKATWAFAAGGIAAAAGVTLFLISRRATGMPVAPAPPISAGLGITPGGAALLVRLTLDP